MRRRAYLSGVLRSLAVLLLLWGAVGPAMAQQTPPAEAAAIDHDAWSRIASRIDTLLADPATASAVLERQRALVVGWREKFMAGESINAGRIATLKDQIATLGPAPAEGATEASDIAARRKDLNAQMAVLKAPSLSAVEAYSRADGLIREIDGQLRERKAQQFLRLWPSPLNPANWPGAWDTVEAAGVGLYAKVAAIGSDPGRRAEVRGKLPIIAALVVVGLVLMIRGRRLFERYALKLASRASSRAQAVWSFLASLGQIVAPVLGVLAFAWALGLLGLSGPGGAGFASKLFLAGVVVFVFRWLGEQGFPKVIAPGATTRMTAERRGEGRFLSKVLGFLIGLAILREAVLPLDQIPEASASVIVFPMILLIAFFTFRLGHILTRNRQDATPKDEVPTYRNQVIGLLGKGEMTVACVAPVLAAIGYVSAARGILLPTIASMALFAALLVMQRFVGDLYALLTKSRDEDAQNALAPVLIGFTLTLLALPLLALIWGARTSDLTELFARFREGFQIGQTHISPASFVTFAVIFAIGMVLTRLVQGALRSSVLPKTKLDTGGKNAILAGMGYIGIFLAALVAINAAGIDLSGLAIVAGALSVGIGFGLQNIVSNFVSGIILLIERPVSEGDWIEVGGVQGTVKSISVRSTRILTFDRSDVIVPNSDLVTGTVTNWTRFSLAGRLIVKVGVGYGSDTRQVERILREIAEAQPLAVMNPPPQVLMMEFGADSYHFEIRIILRDINFSLSVRSDVNHEIARRFAEEGIEIPFGQRDIWLRNPEALQKMWKSGDLEKPSGPPPTGAPEHRGGGPNDPHAEGTVVEDGDGDADAR